MEVYGIPLSDNTCQEERLKSMLSCTFLKEAFSAHFLLVSRTASWAKLVRSIIPMVIPILRTNLAHVLESEAKEESGKG